MIGYKVRLPDDRARIRNKEASLNLIHKYHPETVETREKKLKNALSFYEEALKESEEQAKTEEEKLRIKQIKENIAEWK